MSDHRACNHKPTLLTRITLFWHFLQLHNSAREFGLNELLHCCFSKIKQKKHDTKCDPEHHLMSDVPEDILGPQRELRNGVLGG